MKNLLLLLFLLLAGIPVMAQGTSFATADTIGIQVVKNGILSNTIADHYYKSYLAADGTLRIIRTITNASVNAGTVRTYLYSRNQLQLTYKDNYINASSSITDTFNVYGRARDSFYFRLNNVNNLSFNYNILYDETDISPINETDPNGTMAQAQLITPADTVKGHIGYYGDNLLIDTSDYYKAALSADGTIRLYVTGTNYNGFASTSWAPLIYVYDKGGNLLSIVNSTGITIGSDGFRIQNEYFLPYRSTNRDTMNVYGRAADTVYFRVSNYNSGYTAHPSAYTLRYELIHQSPKNEAEPNNTFAQAQFITATDTVKGHIAYYANNTAIDTNDYYKMAMPADGTVRLHVTGTNYNGYTSNSWAPLIYVYDKAGNQLSIMNMAGVTINNGFRIKNEHFLSFNVTIRDTMNVYGRAADTIYFRVSNYNSATTAYPSAYTLRYEVIHQSPKNEVEPNNTFAQAQLITPADTVKGHIAYYGNNTAIDTNDFYKAVLPADGTIKLYVTGTNYNGYTATSWAPLIYVYDKAGNLLTIVNSAGTAIGSDGFRIKNEYFLPFLNSTQDTMNVYGRAADTVYFKVRNYNSSTTAYPSAYTLRYELIHQNAFNEVEPNNTFAQAQLITSADTAKGHIAYYGNNTGIDTNDYYKAVMPADGTIKLYVTGTNYNGYTATSWAPLIYVYDKAGNQLAIMNSAGTTISNGFRIKNEYFLPFLGTVKDTMNVYGRAADTIYFKVNNYNSSTTAYPATYTLRYEVIHQSAQNEIEPNNTFAEARLITPSDTVKGHIAYYANNTGIDTNDYYKAVLPADGTIKLYVSGTNYNGYTATSWAPLIYVYDKAGNLLTIVNNAGVAIGSDGFRVKNEYFLPFLSTIRDTMQVYGRAADTIYFKVRNYNSSTTAYPSAYTLRYELTDQSPYNEVNPNNTFAEARLITTTDTVKGHISYFSNNYLIDTNDFYKIVKPVNGSIRIFIKGTNYNGYNSTSWAPVVYAYDKNFNPLPVNTVLGFGSTSGMRLRNEYFLPFRSTITDTMTVNCIAGDTVYLRIQNYAGGGSAYASAYTFRYEYLAVAQAAFDYNRTGNEFGFTNHSKFADSYTWSMGNSSTYTSFYPPVINYVPGHYDVRLIAVSNVCNYRDTVIKSFDVAGVEYYTPKSAGAGGDAHIQIYGGALDTSTRITLKRGTTLITPREKYTNTKLNHLTAVMDHHFATPGLYDVIIQVPGQPAVTYTNGFSIDSFKYPTAWSQVIAPSRWRTNVDNRFTLMVGNNGNVTASGVVVAMVWPKNVSVKWLNKDTVFNYTGIDSLVDGTKIYTMPRSNYRYIYDSLVTTTPIDSFEGKPFDGYIRYFLIRHIPANGTVELPFMAKASSPNPQRFITFTHSPNMLGSCPTGNYEDYGNDLSTELIDAADMAADRTKIPLFVAFTKTVKIGQKHMQSAATYAGKEFWAWWDGYETDHNANEGDWIRETEGNNEYARNTATQEVAGLLFNAGVARAQKLNDRINYVNKLLANNPNLSPKSFDKAMDILNTSGKGLGNINYDRLKVLKDIFDGVKGTADFSEKLLKLQELVADCPELQAQLDELLKRLNMELDHNNTNNNNTNSVTSLDPNEIYGPTGIAANRYVNNTQRQPFSIFFENVDTALADAQIVQVIDTIDKTRFDINTLVLGDVVVDNQLFRVPKDRKSFMIQSRMDSVKGIYLRITGTTDTATGIITWQFLSIDSATGNRPLLKGFLPPNIRKPEGQGSVAYTIKPKSSLTDGTIINSRATIIFDENVAIATNVWSNTLDILPPSSNIASATLSADTMVRLKMTGNDNTSGVNKYEVYFSTNNGPWYKLGATNTDSMTIIGERDSSYRFYSIASDLVGNREVKQPVSEASVHIPVGIKTTVKNGTLTVFPNPADRTATIRFELNEAQDAIVNLYNITGQKVAALYNHKATGPVTLHPDLSGLSQGIYTIQITGSKGARISEKLIITH